MITTFDRLRCREGDHWERAGREAIQAALIQAIPEMTRNASYFQIAAG